MALDGGEWSASCPSCFTPRERAPGTHWTYSLTSTLDQGASSSSCPNHFTPRDRAPSTHWIGGWVGLRACLDTVSKRKIISPCYELNPSHLIIQPMASHHLSELSWLMYNLMKPNINDVYKSQYSTALRTRERMNLYLLFPVM
jgi:hypothetical protein